MKHFLVALLSLVAVTAYADPRKFEFDFESWAEGEPQEEAFVVDGKFSIVSKDGNKALQINVGELVDSCALLGDSANGSASLEVKVFASKQGRSFPRYSIGVHGQSGYRLVVFPAKKELQLTKSDEIIKAVPLTNWPSDAWFKVKLEVKKVADKQWAITAKTWPADGSEPTEPQITHEDATLKGQGKCSIWGTPFSGTPILFDDVKIEID